MDPISILGIYSFSKLLEIGAGTALKVGFQSLYKNIYQRIIEKNRLGKLLEDNDLRIALRYSYLNSLLVAIIDNSSKSPKKYRAFVFRIQ